MSKRITVTVSDLEYERLMSYAKDRHRWFPTRTMVKMVNSDAQQLIDMFNRAGLEFHLWSDDEGETFNGQLVDHRRGHIMINMKFDKDNNLIDVWAEI